MAALAPQRTLARIILIALLAGGMLYGLFEARRLLEGPRLSLTWPLDGAAAEGPLVHIKGEAQNIAFLSIDGKQSYADASGHFDEVLALPDGLAVIYIEATDRFGRSATAQATLEVVTFCPLDPQALS